MPLVIPTGFAQASIQIRMDGDPDPWYITHGVDVSAAGGDYSEVASTIAGAWTENILAQLPTSARTSGIQLQVGQDGPDNLTLFFPKDIPGGSTGNKLPQNCAALVTKVTERPGRTGKGRVFIPSLLNETDVSNIGVISPSTLTGLQGDLDAVLAFLATPEPGFDVPAPMVLLHNAAVPGGTTPTIVSGLQIQAVIATQRRRLR